MRVIRRIEHNTRAISFSGIVVFASMGKYVTDFMLRFKGLTVTPLTEAEYDSTAHADGNLKLRLLRGRIECELPGTVAFMADPDGTFRLRERLDAAGFTPEEAHMLASAPELLTDAFEMLG